MVLGFVSTLGGSMLSGTEALRPDAARVCRGDKDGSRPACGKRETVVCGSAPFHSIALARGDLAVQCGEGLLPAAGVEEIDSSIIDSASEPWPSESDASIMPAIKSVSCQPKSGRRRTRALACASVWQSRQQLLLLAGTLQIPQHSLRVLTLKKDSYLLTLSATFFRALGVLHSDPNTACLKFGG